MTRPLPLAVALSCALASAALIAAATRPWGLGALAAVGYAPAFTAIVRQPTPMRAALVAAVAALGSTSVGYEAATGIAAWAYPAAVLLASLPFAAAGAAAGAASRPGLALTVLPLLWCAAEFVPAQSRLLGAYALPLSAVGYSQADLPSVHLARFSSVSAVSLALLAHNALVAGLLALPAAGRGRPPGAPGRDASRRARQRLAASLGLAAIHLSVALAAASAPPSGNAGTGGAPEALVVRVVQPALPRAAYVAAEAVPAAREALLDRLLALSQPTPSEPPADLTVWPETAWPGELRADDPSALARLADVGPLLFGAYGAGDPPTNAAFMAASGVLESAYAKRSLVPLAEGWLAQGSRAVSLVLARPNARLAPLICYDAVFPAVARAAARAGAALLVLLTDDAFAGASDVPLQHLRAARFRAVETGLPVIVASNLGPSAAVAADGRTLAYSPFGGPAAWQVELELGAATRPTPYVRFGDTVGAGAGLLSLAGAVLLRSRGGRPSS